MPSDSSSAKASWMPPSMDIVETRATEGGSTGNPKETNANVNCYYSGAPN